MLRVFHDLIVDTWSGLSTLVHLTTAPLRGEKVVLVYPETETSNNDSEMETIVDVV